MSALRELGRKIRFAPRKIGYAWGPRAMSGLRKRWVIFRHPHATVRFGRYTHVGPGFSLHIPSEGEFIVGAGCEFRRGFRAELDHGASVRIGSCTHFTHNVLIQCGREIEIGDHCNFGQSTALFDGNHRFRDLDVPLHFQGYDLRPLKIADHASITTKCTVMADVGERTFVGANSVVSRDLPAYCLAVGAPARVIDYFGPEGEEPSGWPGSGDEDSASSQASKKPGASAWR